MWRTVDSLNLRWTLNRTFYCDSDGTDLISDWCHFNQSPLESLVKHDLTIFNDMQDEIYTKERIYDQSVGR